jgi:16S rRNA processing protein RimM
MPATDDVVGIYVEGREFRLGDEEGQPASPEATFTLTGVRPYKRGVLARFEEVADRNGAEAVRGRTLLLAADAVRPLDEDEFFLHDLSGLEVETRSGDRIGVVIEVYEGGPAYLLAVDDGERELLIPFSGQMVERVDTQRGVIVIDPPPGLLDL